MDRQSAYFRSPAAALAGVCALILGTLPAAQRPACAGSRPQPQVARTANAPPAFHEETIARIPEESSIKEWIGLGGRLAWVDGQEWQWRVWLDGKQQGRSYMDVRSMAFAPGGTHFVFFGQRNDWKLVLVMDGEERSPAYSKVTLVAFQPHGGSFAYGACIEEEKCSLVLNGTVASQEYKDISAPMFSPDGKRLAYLARRRDKWIAVVDGKQIGPELHGFVCWSRTCGFSPGSKTFFVAGLMKKLGWTYFLDGTPGPGFTALSPIAFSKDGKHYAYGGVTLRTGFKERKAAAIVVDGKAEATYEGVGWPAFWLTGPSATPGPVELDVDIHGISDPSFDSAGNVVYAAWQASGRFVVMDGSQPGPSFDAIPSEILFSSGPWRFAYVAQRGESLVEVRDNRPGTTIPASGKQVLVPWIVRTPDGAHLAYEIVPGGADFTELEPPVAAMPHGASGIAPGQVAFKRILPPVARSGRGSEAWALVRRGDAFKRGKRTVAIDGQPGREYNALGISPARLSEDGRHYSYIVFGARGDRDLVVVDGRESRLYDDVTGLSLASGGESASFFAQDSGHLLRVAVPLR